MSKLSGSVMVKIIEEIKKLSDGSIEDQIFACKEFLRKKIFPGGKLRSGIDKSVVPLLLPTIMKFMESENDVLQKEAADFIASITYTMEKNDITKFVNDDGIIPKLKKLLTSTNPDVTISTLLSLVNIAHSQPEKAIECDVLPLIIQYLKSENEKISYEAASFMFNIAYSSKKCIKAILEFDGIKPLLKILESNDYAACKYALAALVWILSDNFEACKSVLGYGALSSMKKLCDRLFVPKKIKRSMVVTVKGDKRKSNDKKMVKLLAVRFIKNVTSYGEDQIDMVIEEGFVPLILQQISDGLTPEIKIEAIETIEYMIDRKSIFLSTLINDYNLFSFYYCNLRSPNLELLLTILIALKDFIEDFDDKEACRQKIKECGSSTKLQKLIGHENEDVREMAHLINEFVNNVKPVQVPVEKINELIELNDDEDVLPSLVETSESNRKRKCQTDTETSEGPVTRSKRSRIVIEQNVRSVTPDEDDNRYYDLDDYSGVNRSSSVPRNDSPVNSGTIETEEMKPFVLIPRKSSPSDDFVNPTEPLSRQSPDLPEATFTPVNETNQIETKPSLPHAITTVAATSSVDPSRQPVTVPQSETSLPYSVQATPLASNNVLENETSFPAIKYWRPSEFLINKYCENLGIQFNPDNYDDFIRKIKLTPIKSNSIPDTLHKPIDQTGFGAFSILLTGNEDGAKTIKDEINEQYINGLIQARKFDSQKVGEIIGSMRNEHLKVIVARLKCRILIYCSGSWQKYGDFDSNDDSIPLFVLAKNTTEGNTHFDIVLSIKKAD